MFLCVSASILFFNLPFQGSFFVLTIVSSCFLFAALGMGLLISTLSKIQILAAQYSIVVAFLPSYILSGFLFEITSMPKFIQLLTYAIPARYFVENLQTLFLTGNVVPLITINTLCMLLIATFFYLVIAKKFIKRLD
jgi:ABC-2 type transport system permease protein